MHNRLSNKSYVHSGGDIPLLGLTIPEHFAEIVSRHYDRDAVISLMQNRKLSYLELAREIDTVAKGLVALGFGKGDRIGIWSTNNLQWILVQMASARIGAILVTINPAYRVTELDYALKKSDVQCLFTIPAFKSSLYVEMLGQLLPELKKHPPGQGAFKVLPSLQRIIVYDPSDLESTQRPEPGFTLWQELIDAAEAVSDENLDAITCALDMDDPINIQYTSGTTGFPKAVVLSHHNILNNAYFAALAMHFSAGDKLCVPVPFYHCFGMVLSNLLCFSVGATVVMPCEYFSEESVLTAIEQQQCTAVHGVPTMFIAELEHPEFRHFKLDSLRTGIMAGAPCPPELMRRVMTRMHCKEILIGYGETEASPLTHLTRREDSIKRRTETVGRNLPHQEVKIISPEKGQMLLIGEIGEICFRGYHVMHGYYRNPEATAQTIDDQGWLHSGDLGALDRQGYLMITGRLKDMVIRGGENIYPREIEEVILTHPDVAEVSVFGIPDDYYGEELAAWVRLHPGASCHENDIREFCRDKLAHFKIPRYIRFVESFPMTITGKLQKFKMREMMLEEMKS